MHFPAESTGNKGGVKGIHLLTGTPGGNEFSNNRQQIIHIAAGIAIGASSHGIGTSVCAHVSAVQLATGGVSIALTGVATSILIPLLLPFLKTL